MTYIELMVPGLPETPETAKTSNTMQSPPAHILVHYPTTLFTNYSEKVKERHLRGMDKPRAVYYAEEPGGIIVKAIEDMLFERYMPFETSLKVDDMVKITLAPDFINEENIADLVKRLKQVPGSETRNYELLEGSFLYEKEISHSGPLMVH
ncbi:MAG: hypothetical protein GXP63_04195 [DPANN group archaeon]|nr:hypothetical protein [DPANN group archaeon]